MDSELACMPCEIDFPDLYLLHQHTLDQHSTFAQLSVYETFQDDPSEHQCYELLVWRDFDGEFHCPFKGCEIREQSLRRFKRHVQSQEMTHELSCGVLVFKDGVENMWWGPAQNRSFGVMFDPDNICKWGAVAVSSIFGLTDADLRQAGCSLRDRIYSSESDADGADTPSESATSFSQADSKGSASPTAVEMDTSTSRPSNAHMQVESRRHRTTDELIAELREECRMEIYKEMKATLMEGSGNLKESTRIFEELVAWFEAGLRMLKRVDGSEDAYV
ncbi:hypothetical protein BJ508DRAFT_366725 [Ascobolus immersus RN42]|uniref:Uncharacterized protein n=1 Tax=Ascobolus immersus RN42 TaxID=1160509 RepID=A0A3N4HMZ0_ASCIM|nr:hypothetical protein BJ508DRAFT_366725 [Ascobolus immersus RN42]